MAPAPLVSELGQQHPCPIIPTIIVISAWSPVETEDNTNMLELPGQQAHMYHAGLHDSVGSDLQRVNQTLGVDQHHRLNSQQLKLQEGRTDG